LVSKDCIPLCGDQLSVGRAMKIPISGIKGLLGVLHFEECVPFDRKIKRIPGLLGAARAEIETSSAQSAEIIDCLV